MTNTLKNELFDEINSAYAHVKRTRESYELLNGLNITVKPFIDTYSDIQQYLKSLKPSKQHEPLASYVITQVDSLITEYLNEAVEHQSTNYCDYRPIVREGLDTLSEDDKLTNVKLICLERFKLLVDTLVKTFGDRESDITSVIFNTSYEDCLIAEVYISVKNRNNKVNSYRVSTDITKATEELVKGTEPVFTLKNYSNNVKVNGHIGMMIKLINNSLD